MGFLMDPSTWAGLLTLVVPEVVLGIDNLVFITILTDKLPPGQHDKACLLGLSLALIMRLGLLSLIPWMVTLAKPLFTAMDFSFSGRDLIMLFGSIFLLSRVITELHGWLENHDHNSDHGKDYTSFWVIVIQVVIPDAVFLLDAVITTVGMVNHLLVMMVTVATAMVIMLLASKPLTRFTNQHPAVAVLCLSFLLVISLSLVAESFGFHIPKGYLYAAIGLSIVIGAFNQITRHSFIRHQSTSPLWARTADATLRLMGGKRQADVQHDADSPMPTPIPEGASAEEERYMINGVLTLMSRSLRGIVTPCDEISWVDANLEADEIREQLLSPPRNLFPVCRDGLGETTDIVRAKELLVALEEGADVAAIASTSPTIIVPETLNPTNLLGVLRRARGSFVIVTSESGMVRGLVMSLDVLKTITGEFPDADEAPEIITDGDDWLVKGGTGLYTLQQALSVEHLVDDDDIVTVAGLVILTNGRIPRVGDMIDVGLLHITIIEANGYRVGLVHIVEEQPVYSEDE